ncbi:MAG TPA: Na+/H+ antiporter subunit D [Egibacteraceae bacterium]|nr:Na+/H+ antiporter subunit D [Egibacteraceae bacterium]
MTAVAAVDQAIRVPGEPVGVLVLATVLLPLVGAAVTMLVHGHVRLQRAMSLAVTATTAVIALAVLAHVAVSGTVVVQAGGWPAPYGISLVVDRLSAVMVAVGAVMVAIVLLYSVGLVEAHIERLFFHPVYLVLGGGVSAAFLTGDLFNLFVAFEIMLIASYVLLTLGATKDQIRAGMTYVVINLVASTLFVVGVALLYASTGTVSFADLAVKVADLPAGLRSGVGVLFLVTFGIKAALFPLFFWLPDAYPTAPSPITAVFAGLLTKVGVYAVIRTQTLLFAPADGQASTLLLFVAGATMVVGVLGAVAQNDIKRILSFHIVSQIGYMILGLGLFTVAGLAGAIFYVIHHIVVKTALFCVGGAVEHGWGSSRLDELSGVGRQAPLLALLFGVAALSLAGLPPFSGFVAKLALVEAGLAGGHYTVVTAALVVSMLTLYSMSKIWAGAFWGAPTEGRSPQSTHSTPSPRAPADGSGGRSDGSVAVVTAPSATRTVRRAVPRPMLLATSMLVVLSMAIALNAEAIHQFSLQAADELLDPTAYVDAVTTTSERAR